MRLGPRIRLKSNIMDTTLGIGEVAESLGVSVPTIRRTADELGLTPHRTDGGHRRFTRSDVDRLIEHLGITPSVDGLSSSEVKVLAALSQRPMGLRSLRAVARAAKVSPTTAQRATARLAEHGLIRAETEIVAEGVAREVVVYRLAPGPEWSRIASQVMRTVVPVDQRQSDGNESRRPSKVPRRFWHHFWNVDPSLLRLPKDGRFIAKRMLLSTEPAAWGWAARNLDEAAIRSVLGAREVDPPRAALIENLLAAQ